MKEDKISELEEKTTAKYTFWTTEKIEERQTETQGPVGL